MYAVIESGGKQFRVELGSEIEVETMDGEPGSTIELGRVLLVADGDESQIGRPVVEGARVSASVVRQDRGPKLVVFKYRPKARHRAQHGHRQGLTRLRVSDIVLGNRSAAREEESKRSERERYRIAAEEDAARKASADEALARKLARQAEADKADKADKAEKAGKAATAGKAGKAARGPARASGRGRPATSATKSPRGTTKESDRASRKSATSRAASTRGASKEPARRTQAGGTSTARTPSRPAKSATQSSKPTTTAKSTAQKPSGTSARKSTTTSKTQAAKTSATRRSTKNK